MKYWHETFISHLKKNEKVSKKMSATISKAYKFSFYSSPIFQFRICINSGILIYVHLLLCTHFGARI